MKSILKLLPIVLILACNSISEKQTTEKSVINTNKNVTTDSVPIKTDSEENWYEKYRKDYERVSYGSIKDSLLRIVLEYYFVCDSNNQYLEYTCNAENDTSDKKEHAFHYSITIKLTSFDSSKHIITRASDGFVYLIDGKVFWGTEGWLPNVGIDTIIVSCNGENILVPKTEYCDLYTTCSYNCNPEKLHFTDGINSYIVIMANGGDGSYAFKVAWIIKNGKYLRRVIDSKC